jgi:hypothetical protein
MRKVQQLLLTPAAVGNTSTVMLRTKLPEWGLLTLEVENTDGSQTLSCVINRRLTASSAWSESSLPDLADIPAGQARCVDIDCRGTYELEVRGTASGAGLTANVAGILVENP